MEIPLRLTAVFEESQKGGYNAFFEEMPEVNTKAETLEEAKMKLAQAYQTLMSGQQSIDVTERKKSLLQLIKRDFTAKK